MKFEITLELIEEMAECIHDCSWVSGEEIAAYMKSCVTDGNYDPEDWSEKGQGHIAKERSTVKSEFRPSKERLEEIANEGAELFLCDASDNFWKYNRDCDCWEPQESIQDKEE